MQIHTYNVRLVDVEYNMMNGNIFHLHILGNNSRQDKSKLYSTKKNSKCIERYMDKVVTKKKQVVLSDYCLCTMIELNRKEKLEKINKIKT